MNQLSKLYEFNGFWAEWMPIKSVYRQKVKAFKNLYIHLNTNDLDSYNRAYYSSYQSKINYNIYLGIHLLESVSGIGEYDRIIDLGGGIGFNSALFAFLFPHKEIMYLDVDPASAKSAEILNHQLGLKNITYKIGSLEENKDLITENCLLSSRDVIEHIYDLKSFFALSSLAKTNIHNTAAVLNSYLRRNEFKRIHEQAEYKGNNASAIKERDSRKAYYNQRVELIQDFRPDLSADMVHETATLTRGLKRADIEQYIANKILPKHHKSCLYSNTCDPYTGNWAERTISKKDYQAYAGNVSLKFRYPQYNVAGAQWTKRIPLALLNLFATFTGKHEIQPSFSIIY